jgi:hypothetical protein
MYRGISLVSLYIFPIYSPSTPIEIKINDPKNQTDKIKEDHPAIAFPVK